MSIVSESERPGSWTCTGECRYVRRKTKELYASCNGDAVEMEYDTLQQRWVYIDGSSEWRDVETVEEEYNTKLTAKITWTELP